MNRIGDDTFRFAVIVVDSATAETMRPGASFDALPSHSARDEITVHRRPE
jgi:hypothetical protein